MAARASSAAERSRSGRTFCDNPVGPRMVHPLARTGATRESVTASLPNWQAPASASRQMLTKSRRAQPSLCNTSKLLGNQGDKGPLPAGLRLANVPCMQASRLALVLFVFHASAALAQV